MCLDKNMGELFSFDLGKVFLGKTKKNVSLMKEKKLINQTSSKTSKDTIKTMKMPLPRPR